MTGQPEDFTATLLRAAASFPHGTFTLRVADGPDAGASLTLRGEEPARLLIGSSPACDLRLSDPMVSRRHAALELRGSQLLLTDLDSTNGTFVGELQVQQAFLRGGETVRLGEVRLLVTHAANAENPEVPFARGFGRLLGESREMRRLYPLCEKLARSRVPVVIEGETGTGKEVLAESLHESGPLAGAPFIVFDCTAVPPSLLESELFGHEKGAFTGALAQRRGLFEQAHGGTLFIDEIGDLDPALQPKLLRALEKSEVRRVGGDRFIRADVRVIAATRRDLDREVQDGRFRDDLFHRVAVTRIELPPLRSRRGDVSLLARHFWRELCGEGEPSPALLARWEAWSFPGNVRELRNAVARAIALGDEVSPPAAALAAAPAHGDAVQSLIDAGLPFAQARKRLQDEFERRYVERVLEQPGGNVSRAAAASGIARRQFQRIKSRV